MSATARKGNVEETERIAQAYLEHNGDRSGLRYLLMYRKITQAVKNCLLSESNETEYPMILEGDEKGLARYGPWLYCEEVAQTFDMRRHDLKNVRLISYGAPSKRRHMKSKRRGRRYYFKTETHWKMKIPNLSKGIVTLVPGDMVLLESCSGRILPMKIRAVHGDFVIFGYSNFYLNRLGYNAYLFSSGVPFIRCHDALREMAHASTFGCLFEDGVDVALLNNSSRLIDEPLEISCWIDRSDSSICETIMRLEQLDQRQRLAVESIMAAKCRPYPYIIFGPPGTGKTATIIEAIVQIYVRNVFKKILLCANSNLCADHLYRNLGDTGVINCGELKRFTTNDKLSDFSKTRIVVATNISAGRLEHKYDYVFLDEAGHAHIPESLVPWNKLSQTGCMVLAGDPYQLGPVIKSRMRGNPLERSVLEWFFAMKRYKKEQDRYDNRFITKLNVCYRCDARILGPSNKLFYDSELICKGQTPPELLEKLGLDHPIVHISCMSEAVRPHGSTSWHNPGQVDVCMHLLKILYEAGIEPSKIGLVSPYALQTKELAKALHAKIRQGFFPGPDTPGHSEVADEFDELLKIFQGREFANHTDRACKVDTVDAFQGDEREVMIISTTRNFSSGLINQKLDFLNDRRRFNVSVSRAKWLVFVVGDPKVLQSSDWAAFVENAHHLFGQE